MGVWNVNTAYESELSNAKFVATDGLILKLDADDLASYPGSGTTWFDTSGNANHMTFNGTVTWGVYDTIRCMNFETGGYLTPVSGSNIGQVSNATLMVFSSIRNNNSDWRTLIRGSSSDHQVIIASGTDNLGMYDGSSGFLAANFNITSLPNPYTKFNCLTWRLSQTAPQYRFSYNGQSSSSDISNSSASYTEGIYYLGGASGQYWGKIALVLYYNRILTTDEIYGNYAYYKGRFGV